jgi:hypothetical protein
MMWLLLSLALTLPAQARTLIISDSHGEGAYGSELASLIEKEQDVSFYAFGGTAPADWIEGFTQPWGFWEYHSDRLNLRGQKRPTPLLQQLVSDLRPERVIISLGTNLIWREHLPKDIEYIRSLIEIVRASGAECIWVGSPDLNPTKPSQIRRELEVRGLLKLEVKNCQLIESWSFTHYPDRSGDGIHYDAIALRGKDLARNWARDVFHQLPIHPITFDSDFHESRINSSALINFAE